MNRYYYRATIAEFLNSSKEDVWGQISANSRLDDNAQQKDSWSHEISALQ